MAWRDTLVELRDELAEARAERQQQALEAEAERTAQRGQLIDLADSLKVSGLLGEMNNVLLDGSGTVETYRSWENPEPESVLDDDLSELFGADTDDQEFDDSDVYTLILAWEEEGEREVAVDLGVGDDGIYLQVNGVDVRPDSRALELALVEAFRDELEI